MGNVSYYTVRARAEMNSAGMTAVQSYYTHNYLRLLPPLRHARIVDLGCSEGISLEWLLNNGYQNITGVDSDVVATDIARQKFGSRLNDDHIVCMDMFSYLKGCESNSIDMFLMLNVIEHISKDVIIEVMSEIRRALKEGGHLLVQTGNWENPFNIGLFTRDFTHQVMYAEKSLRQLMIMAEFSEDNIKLHPVRYKTTLRNLPLQILAPIVGRLVKMFALCMRIRIHETSPLIYCLVKK